MFDPIPLLQSLIRIDTTNPPGNETRCVNYLLPLLEEAGIDVRVLGPDPDRANLVARVPGRGQAPPLLLHAHSDVVPVAGQRFDHPPFEGLIVDDHVWGRGAIDMKGGLAMMLAALFRVRESGRAPAGDVVLAVVADEEAGSAVGARYLVNEHPELFQDVRYAIGEEAGAAIELAGIRFQPIVVAEKRACWLRLTLRGPGGHGSRLAAPDNPVQRLGRVLTELSGARLPRHMSPAADRMLGELCRTLPEPLSSCVARVRADGEADHGPQGIPQREALYIDSVLRHTANPTIVRTGDKINVLPSEITVDVDGRILPGEFTVDDFIGELRERIGPEPEIELLLEGSRVDPSKIVAPEFGAFYETMADIITKADPDAVPLPMIAPASTDARLFAQLGIRCYGWLPMKLPAGSDYRSLLHIANERVPVAAIRFGADRLTELLLSYSG